VIDTRATEINYLHGFSDSIPYFEYIYKLETHLKRLCVENTEYENLIATWYLNKKACHEMLKNIPVLLQNS
jgi:hypothetical protein